MVECTGLENRHGFIAHPGFKSLLLRHIQRGPLVHTGGLFRISVLMITISLVQAVREWRVYRAVMQGSSPGSFAKFREARLCKQAGFFV